MGAVRGAGFLPILLFGWLACAHSHYISPPPPVCPLIAVADFLFPSNNEMCLAGGADFLRSGGVIEGNEVTLQKALNFIHKNDYDYVALLFYSSWCPFSRLFRPIFSLLSSIFTSIPHLAIEESAVRPSILSKYGVRGFPSLILLNSTVGLRYQGPRTLESIVAFYDEFTGIKASTDRASLDKIGCSLHGAKHEGSQETCPFPWARSPENLLHQETYLTLATIFVILRLLHLVFPTLRRCTQSAWRTYTTFWTMKSFWERAVLYLNQVIHFLNSLKQPCKNSNLQEGAKNAKSWASKSLASVSLGDTSSSCDAPVSRSC